VKTKWQSREASDFITTIHISGFDKQGLIADVVQIITVTMNLNMRSFHIDSTGEVFEANIKVMVSDTSQLNHLMAEIRKLNGIEVVYRLNSAPDKQV